MAVGDEGSTRAWRAPGHHESLHVRQAFAPKAKTQEQVRKEPSKLTNHTALKVSGKVVGAVEKIGAAVDEQSEASCALVSTRGIMKSCDVYPLHPLSDTKNFDSGEYQFSDAETIDHQHYIETMQRSGGGAVVYVITSALPAFRKNVLPKVNHSFVLVTGDAVVEPETVLGDDFQAFIADARILKWFAQNTVMRHEKLVQIPVGLDYHTLSEKATDWGPKTSPQEQEKSLQQIQSEASSFESRDPTVFTDKFDPSSHKSRSSVWKSLSHQSNILHIQERTVPRNELWNLMTQHRFVVSPRGKGIDCHRTWEALVLGCVPLVSAGPHNRIFEDHGLRVIEMDDKSWDNVASDEIQAAMTSALQQKTFAEAEVFRENTIPPPLYLKYWVSQFRDFSKIPVTQSQVALSPPQQVTNVVRGE